METIAHKQELESLNPQAMRLKVGRHDNHNLEIKSVFDVGSFKTSSEVQLYVFMPTSANLQSYDKSRIVNDFNSRSRLAFSLANLHRGEDLVRAESGILAALENVTHEAGGLEDEKLLDSVRQYGAIAAEFLKMRGETQAKNLLMVFSLMSKLEDRTRLLRELSLEVESTYDSFNNLRVILGPLVVKRFALLEVLETYLHHLLVNYLGSLEDQMRSIEVRSQSGPARGRSCLRGSELIQGALRSCSEREAKRAAVLQNVVPRRDRRKQELAVLRFGHMKKFFQSVSFLEVNRKDVMRRLSEPAAVVGAAFAGLAVASFEYFSTHGLGGVQGAVLLSGVLLYTVKDRLKDLLRKSLLVRASKFVPDLKQDLLISGKMLGQVCEWFSTRAAVPPEIRKLREAAYVSHPEKHLQEDVLYYRRRIQIDAASLAVTEKSFQDVIRVNLERYLKHFDDHEKSFRFISADGKLAQVRSHRVYHFHVGIQAVMRSEKTETTSQKLFRVVLDKNGIDRVEPLFV